MIDPNVYALGDTLYFDDERDDGFCHRICVGDIAGFSDYFYDCFHNTDPVKYPYTYDWQFFDAYENMDKDWPEECEKSMRFWCYKIWRNVRKEECGF